MSIVHRRYRPPRRNHRQGVLQTGGILTLDILTISKDYKKNTHFQSNFGLTRVEEINSGIEYMSVLHSQYHACWCTGDFQSQCIRRNGIEPKAGIFHARHQQSE